MLLEAAISHVIYLNDCRPDGCIVNPGGDDARTDRSSLAENPVHLDAWRWGDARWAELVACVTGIYAPFDITITTTDPGMASHSEVMVAGTPEQLGAPHIVSGVAPGIVCGATFDNAISFAFAGGSNDIELLCNIVAQESAHVFGLDHEMNSYDPMTYLGYISHRSFQNTIADCGEYSPRPCFCGTPHQNTAQYLAATFGARTPLPPAVRILSPGYNAWVHPGFTVSALADSLAPVVTASFAIDGAAVTTAPPDASLAWSIEAPVVAPGDHEVSFAVTDDGARMAAVTVPVHVMTACTTSAGCDDDTTCFGGFCVPGASIAGGLGASCQRDTDCITGACAGEHCTGTCEAGCGAGYTCASDLCVPDAGGCSAGGSPSLLVLLFLGRRLERRQGVGRAPPEHVHQLRHEHVSRLRGDALVNQV